MTEQEGGENDIDAIVDVEGYSGLPILVPWRREFRELIPSYISVEDKTSRQLSAQSDVN